MAIEREMRDVMKCVHCQGAMRRGADPYRPQPVSDSENVPDTISSPAWICAQRGDPLFGELLPEMIHECY